MSKQIYITHTEEVSTKDAIQAVYVAVIGKIEAGETMTLSNGLGVALGRTKNPSFYVWRREQ